MFKRFWFSILLVAVLAFGLMTAAGSVAAHASIPVATATSEDEATDRPAEAQPLPIAPSPTLAARPAGPVGEAAFRPAGAGYVVTWRTDRPTTGWLVFGDAPDALESRIPAMGEEGPAATDHRVRLPASVGDAPFYFAIVVDGVRADEGGWPFKITPDDTGRLLNVIESSAGGPSAPALQGGQAPVPEVVPTAGQTSRFERVLLTHVRQAVNDQLTERTRIGASLRPVAVRSITYDGHIITADFEEALRTWPEDARAELIHRIDLAADLALAQAGLSRPSWTEYHLTAGGRPLNEGLTPAEADTAGIPAAMDAASGIAGKRIILNPGHGRYDNGAGGWPFQRGNWWGAVEDLLNADYAVRLRDSLAGTGADLRPTRQLNKSAGSHGSGYVWWEMDASEYIRSLGAPESVWKPFGMSGINRDIRARPEYAKWVAGNVIVSIHNNGGGGAGTETWYDFSNGYQGESKRLADIVHGRIIRALKAEWNANWIDRTVKGSDQYGENRWFNGPAILIEVGFMDNQSDNAAIRDGRFQSIVTAAIRDGLIEYYGGSGDADDNRTIGMGQSLSGTISPANDLDTYYFDAPAGSRVTIRMDRAAGTSLDSFLRLYDAGGTQIAYNDDSNGTLNSTIGDQLLSAGGRYRIVAHSYANGSTGGYTLTLSGGGTSCPDGQYKAEYYNNRSLSGGPVVTRCESSINYDWGGGSPVSGVGADNFSVRWTGRFNFAGGNTRFIATADDGVRVYLDGGVIIDAWRDQGPTEYRVERSVGAGMHEAKVEYYENGGGAVARLRWEQVTGGCTPNADQVALFVDSDYRGQCVVKGIGSYSSPSSIGLPNDAVSSVKVGANVRLTVFEHDNYGGRSSGFTGDDANLSDNNIGNDSVSSAKVEPRSGGSSNLARGKPAAASSQESSSYHPGRGNDGDNNTRWSSMISTSLGTQWWYTDLGSTQTLNRVKINWEASYAATYQVIWSVDGNTWYYPGSNYSRSSSGWADHSIGSFSARYVGVQMLTRAPRMNNYSFFEFEAYNSSRSRDRDRVAPESVLPDLELLITPVE